MLYDVIGWIGALLLVTAYFLAAARKLTAASPVFHGMNLVGGLGVALSAYVHGAMPPVALNTVWAGIAVYGLFRATRGEPAEGERGGWR
jgi:hypothetical protein